MTEVFFYHLERSEPQEVLPSLLEKTLARGWRALVKLPDAEAVGILDEALWTYRDESFLPHGSSGADEPILLTTDDDAVNGAQAVFLTPGTTMTPDAMRAFERCVLLFLPDGADGARAQWRILKDEGFVVTYWKQTLEGRWEKAAG
ncbi:MAG: DNA polymerase III subunit chi [Pseudomonadota bacterium]